MDRTVLYREIVRVALDGEAEPRIWQPPEPDAFTVEVNSVAEGLARLRASLKQMRPRYLAMSGLEQMRESEKDEFDLLVRKALQGEQQRVRTLEQLELRRAAEQPRGLRRWLASPETAGLSETLAKHRQGMFFYLNSLLQLVSGQLAELQQIRSAREIVKPMARVKIEIERLARSDASSSISGATSSSLSTGGRSTGSSLTGSTSSAGSAVKRGSVASTTSSNSSSRATTDNTHITGPNAGVQNARGIHPIAETAPDDAPPTQSMQLMMEEHDALLADLSATLEKAQRAEQSLREVAELQSELSQHLSAQSQQLESLTHDAFRTSTDVQGANKQLDRAKRSNRRASRFIIFGSLATGAMLLLLNGR